MSQTLYRKYRPKKFSEIIGQKPIVKTLQGALKSGRVGQAYIFSGPRGTGKTTLARLFAKTLNCQNTKGAKLSSRSDTLIEPCLKCSSCQLIQEGKSMDIIEIDAASHTGVDHIRELRQVVKLSPTLGKYKVYIIDEAHMLSSGAFNALLKTLEEPPAHAIFILATTAIHKIPETILSRCQHFEFSRLSTENIIKKLSQIARSEKVSIEKEALEMIALSAEGGMRDAESLLSQIMSLEDKKITAKEIEKILGTATWEKISRMSRLLAEKNISGALLFVNELARDGYELEIFSQSLVGYLRQALLLSINPELEKIFSSHATKEQSDKLVGISRQISTQELIEIIRLFDEARIKTKTSPIPQLPLEIAIIKAISDKKNDPSQNQDKDNSKNSSGIGKRLNIKNAKDIEYKKTIENKKKDSLKYSFIATDKFRGINKEKDKLEKSDNNFVSVNLNDVKNNWRRALQEIKTINYSLSAVLSNCLAVKIEKGDIIIIATKYSLYKDKLNSPDNQLTITKVFSKLLKTPVKIRTISEKEAGVTIKTSREEQTTRDKKTEKKNHPSSLLDNALKLMGGKMV